MKQSILTTLVLCTILSSFNSTFGQEGSWNRVSDFEQEIWRASAFTVNDTAFVAFGFASRNGSPLNGIRAYDQTNDSWITKSSFPGKRRGDVKAIVHGNEVYFFGGNDRTVSSSLSEHYNDFWKYDPILDEWDSLGLFPSGEKLSDMEGFVIGDTIYIGLPFRNSSYDPERILYAYNPSTNEFAEKDIGFRSGKMFSYNERGFLVSDSVYEYHAESNSWTSIASVPDSYVSRKDNHFVVNDKLYIIRFHQDYTNNTDGEKSMISYDLTNNQWTEEEYGGKLAEHGVSFVLNGNAYYGSGDTGVSGINFISDFFQFDLSKESFSHPDDLAVSEIGVNHISLHWEDGSGNESAFIIERNDASHGPFSVVDTVSANSTEYTDTLLLPNTVYKYYVRAINNENPGGVYSNMLTVQTKDYPATPDTLVASGLSAKSIWLSWVENANNEDGFVIRRKTDTSDFVTIDSVAADEFEYIDSGLDSIHYTYQIFAINDVGTSDTVNSNTIIPYYNPVGGWIPKERSERHAGDWSVGASANDKIYVNRSQTNDWLEYDSNSDSWTEKTQFPGETRDNAVAFAIGDTVYLGLGSNGHDRLSDFWAYSISGDNWTQITDMPESTSNKPHASANGRGYVLGSSDKLYEYNPTGGVWSEKAQLNADGFSSSSSAVSIDGALYLGMGYLEHEFYAYDTEVDQWNRKADFPGAIRNQGVAFESNGKAFFGTGGIYGQQETRDDFWRYDPSNDSWERSSSLPTPTTRSLSFTLESEGYVYDGRGYSQPTNFYKYEEEVPNFATKFEGKAIEDTIKLSWIDNATNEQGFYIFRASDNETKTCIDTLSENLEFYSDLKISPTTLYTYEVVAFNEHGTTKPTVTKVRAFSDVTPEPPLDLRLYINDRNSTGIAWTTTNPDTEEIYYIDVSSNSFQDTLAQYSNFKVANNSIKILELEPQTTYQIRVRSFNYFNISENSEVFEWTTESFAPNAPLNLTTSEIDSTSASIVWEHHGVSADTFFIDVSSNNFIDTLDRYKNYPTTEFFQLLNDLEPNTNYQLRIRASYLGYSSENSDTLTFKTESIKPLPRSGAISFIIDEIPYIGLGQNSDSTFVDLWRKNLSDDSYNRVNSFPGTARSEAVAFTIDGIAYVGSGRDKDGNVLSDFYSYDPVANEWAQVADLGGGSRSSAVAFVLEGEGYVGTGKDATTELKDFWKYDPSTDSWSEVTGFTGDERQEATAFVIGNVAYVSGGVSYSNGTTQFSDVQSFDPTTEAWSEEVFADIDLNFNSASSFVLKDKAFISYGNQENITVYDPATDEITNIGDTLGIDDGEIGNTRADAISFVVSDTAYFGFGASGFSPTVYYNDLLKFFIPNAAPTDIVLDNQNVNENEETGTLVGTISATDEDAEDTHTFELVPNGTDEMDNEFFQISDAELVTSDVFNYEEKDDYTIHLRATDSNGAFVEKMMSIVINDVNDAPTFSDQSFVIDENTEMGVSVGQIVAADEDNDAITFAITSSTATGAFIIENDLIKVEDSSQLDFESSPSIVLTVSADDEMATSEAYVTIDLSNINEAPILTVTSYDVEENSLNESVVGQLGVNDPENDEVTASIISGNDGNTFYITGDHILINDSTLLDFESKTTFELGLEITDSEKQTNEIITINVININEAPSINNLTFSVSDGSENGSIVGDLQSADPENDEVGFTILTAEAASVFEINSDGEILVSNADLLDAELTPTYNFEVEVTDFELSTIYDVEIMVQKALGLSDNIARIYPNPAANFLYINHDKIGTTGGKIYVYSQEGKEVIHHSKMKNKLDVSNLTPGIYTLVIRSDQKLYRSKFKVN